MLNVKLLFLAISTTLLFYGVAPFWSDKATVYTNMSSDKLLKIVQTSDFYIPFIFFTFVFYIIIMIISKIIGVIYNRIHYKNTGERIYYKENHLSVTNEGYKSSKSGKVYQPSEIKSTEYDVLIPTNKIKAFIHFLGAFFVFTIVPSLRNSAVPTELAYVVAPILVISALYHFSYTKIRVTLWLVNGKRATVDFISSKYARKFQKAIQKMKKDYEKNKKKLIKSLEIEQTLKAQERKQIEKEKIERANKLASEENKQ
ncbi:hypothetical protein [Arcobacter sp.]|uniref:hypothetical protein n=1 Tax=unclassified Arcobacter TaxID=2593671 RepID=UPI003B009A37|eukprot:TRINITY_DN5872_c2_g1_i5.p1 TRINITY_DN5872_c2_g1~~TRINITY_DN5872_c2_g1_i5.p1  ORF type:complete len:257 (-),score=-63.46 TRINITY_DN5872_c2_g1_i5:631-1401(-)